MGLLKCDRAHRPITAALHPFVEEELLRGAAVAFASVAPSIFERVRHLLLHVDLTRDLPPKGNAFVWTSDVL